MPSGCVGSAYPKLRPRGYQMNRETIFNMPMQERIAYFNGRLADG